MTDSGLRARVERLLRGDMRSDDITRLFLYARDRCDGRESVQEVGDFVAHHDERTKGIVTRTTRDWFTCSRFFVPHMRQELIDGTKLPPNFAEVLAAGLRRHEGHQFIKKHAGVTYPQATRMLPALVAKFATNPDGTLAVTPAHTQVEMDLMTAIIRHLIAKPAFTSQRLYDDFAATLKSHALLSKDEVREFKKLYPAISLFAVAVMHNCRIQMTGGEMITLTADGHANGNIGVSAAVPVDVPGKRGVRVASAIFLTDLPAGDHCTFDLVNAASQGWRGELELTDKGLLGRIA